MSSPWLLSVVVTGLFSLAGSVMPAREHSRDVDDRDRTSHTKFDDRDRQAAREWLNEHRENLPQGFREQDRLSPDQESRLQPGVILDSDTRRRIRPAPVDLLRRLPPPARHYRYAAVDDHILLVEDRTWSVSDIIHLHPDASHQG
jgi:Ni/Co efflux regulator RcnB